MAAHNSSGWNIWSFKDVSWLQNLPFMDVFTSEPGVFRILQPIWDLRLGWEKYVESPGFPIVFSLSMYFLCVTPWIYVDLYGTEWKWVRKYKIQPNKKVTWPAIRKAVVLTMWNNLLYILPVSIAQWVWTPSTYLPPLAPTLWEFCWQQYAAFVIFDFEYYAWHVIHHKVRFLYRHVHSVHHEYHAPHSWVSQYLHPWELITIGFLTTTAPWYFKTHPMTQWNFMLFMILISVEGHIGYDLPLMPHHWAPFWGGSPKHDMHHQKPRTNYQPFLNQFDKFFGTECPGMRAGGYRSPELIAWEKNNKESLLNKRRHEKALKTEQCG